MQRKGSIDLRPWFTKFSGVDELIPVGPLQVRVKLPADVRGTRARFLVAGKTVAAGITAGWSRTEFTSILDDEVIVVGLPRPHSLREPREPPTGTMDSWAWPASPTRRTSRPFDVIADYIADLPMQ